MKIKALIIAAIAHGGICQLGFGAISVNIAGEPSSNLATVTLNGSVQLAEYTSSGEFTAAVLAVNPFNSLGLNGLGNVATYGAPTSAFATASQTDIALEIGPGSDTAIFSYRDISNGNSVLASGSIHNMVYLGGSASAGSFQLITPIYFFPSGSLVDAGDILEVSGSFDLQLVSGTFASRFNPGVYTGSYIGQDITVTVTPVPEASSILLIALGCAAGLFRRRRRRSTA